MRSDAPSRALPVEDRAQPLASLLARVEAATGPDRETDAAIWLHFTPGATRWSTRVRHAKTGHEWDVDETRDATGYLVTVPDYTASLDAALALVERTLPSWMVSLLLSREHGRHFASVRNGSIINPDKIEGTGEATTPALALLAALLKALQAQPNRIDARDGSSPQTQDAA